ncbi:MAG: ArsR/SmtB family transcription factor [Desulfotomaculales bacterium]
MELRRLTTYFKALADPTRLRILGLLAEQEMCVCELMAALNLPQPLVSHHLRVLRQAGVVQDDRCGRWICYRLTPEFVALFRDFEDRIVGPAAAALGRGVRPSAVRRDPSVCERLRESCAALADDPRPPAPGTDPSPAAAEPEVRM